MNQNFRFIILTVGLGLLGLLAGATAWRMYAARNAVQYESLVVLPEPRIIADFALTDDSGKAISLEDLKGHWSVLFFGFTSCPDVCPNTLFALQQARQQMLENMPQDALPRIYLVSVDPERDSPEKLASYLAYFDPEFIGLTGSDAQIHALAFQLGIAYFVEPHESGQLEYNVDHSASLLLLNPAGQLQAVLPAPHSAEGTAHDLVTLIKQKSGEF